MGGAEVLVIIFAKVSKHKLDIAFVTNKVNIFHPCTYTNTNTVKPSFTFFTFDPFLGIWMFTTPINTTEC